MKELLKIFKALSDETRLKILKFLLSGEKCVCEIVPFTKRTQSTVSIQLAKLEHLGIVESRREGKSVYYRIVNENIRKVLKFMNYDLKHVGNTNEIRYKPIGIIHSPFKESKGTPIQSVTAENVKGLVEVFPEYVKGLKNIEGFSYIILIYHFHLSRKSSLEVKPYMDEDMHGVFATRAPSRPNPIGISTVQLIKIKDNLLHIRGVDILDKTPLLDIKPYVPEFDIRNVKRNGWLEKKIQKLSTSKDDGRFMIKNRSD